MSSGSGSLLGTIVIGCSDLQALASDEDPLRRSRNPRGRIRRSCDFCFMRKKKCDGDGVNRCSYCVSKGQVTCIYGNRRHLDAKPKKKRAKARASHEPMRHSGSKIRRFYLSASRATGLVGMDENAMLRDFFACLGHLHLTSPSDVRGAIVNIMSPASQRGSLRRRGVVDQTRCSQPLSCGQGDGASMEAADASSEGLLCAFWCAVAMGGLLQGRTEMLVANYTQLAEDALLSCRGRPTIETARALGIMSVLYGLLGRDQDVVATCLQERASTMGELAESQQFMGEGFASVAGHLSSDGEVLAFLDDNLKFYSPPNRCSRKPVPQLYELGEGNMLAHVFETTLRMWEIYRKSMKEKAGKHIGPETGEPEARWQYSEHDGASGSNSRVKQNDARLGLDPTSNAALHSFLQDRMGEIKWLGQASRRPSFRWGSAVLVQGLLIIAGATMNDREGVIDAAYRCADAFIRYPGLGRLAVYHPIFTVTTLVIASTRDHAIYDKLAAGFNALCLMGTPPTPSLEGRLEHVLCDHLVCRTDELFLRERGWGLICSSDLPGHLQGLPTEDKQQKSTARQQFETPNVSCETNFYGPGSRCMSPEEASVGTLTDKSPATTVEKSDLRVPDAFDLKEWKDLATILLGCAEEPPDILNGGDSHGDV